MSDGPDITRQLRRELDETRLRLAEAEETLEAIRHGEADGFVIAGPQGPQVFTLQGALEPYRLLIEQMSEGALTLSRDGVILYANQAFAALLQLPPGRVIGTVLRDFLPAADQSALAGLIATALNGSSSGEVSLHAAVGSTVTLRLGLHRLQLGAETLICAVATDITVEKQREIELRRLAALLEARVAERTADLAASRVAALNMMEEAVEGRKAVEEANRGLTLEITEREQAEEALRASSAYVRSLIEASLDPLVTISAEGKITDVNEASVQATGVPREQLIGTDFSDYFTAPDKAREGYWRVFAEGWVRDYPLAIRHVSGRITDVVYNASVYRDEQGNVLGVFAAARDVTERKRAQEDLRQLNAELEQRVQDRTAQLEAANQELEAFSYSVSHDLRTPLRAMDGFSLALAEDYAGQLDERAQNYLRRIRAGSKRMAELIDDLLNLSHLSREAMHRERVDLTAMAREVGAELQRANPGRTVELVLAPALTADADARMLQVVLSNLLGNAWKFTGKRDGAKIEVGAVDQDGGASGMGILPMSEGLAQTHGRDARATAGQRVFCVRDNGVGFDMAYADKLFGAFQRLHSVQEFEGNGIGLALVQRIVRRHGGRVWAEGAVGQGATFYFTLGKNAGAETP